MARAHRHYLPGCTWHITQRCHKKEFLFRFKHYKKRWMYWLYRAKQQFHISILDYMVTSNHIHLLALSDGKENEIAKTMHLVSGRTAWEFNHNRNRKGAFWEDRYHATAVETDNHLIRCMIYIDMNMVRAGVIKHPEEWPHCGYQELIGNKQRYSLINKERLMRMLQLKYDNFKEIYNEWIDEYLERKNFNRESCWTESIAVGNKIFVERIKKKLGVKARRRCIVEKPGTFKLKEPRTSYLLFPPIKKGFKG
ncbi:MAG: transposase [Candidatus Aminicenantes bacterium]|nr:transposase [Candidatus Aminicenantes bacterium]